MDRSVVGRESEFAAALLGAQGPGVVLSGPPGVGKTALARLLADRLAADGAPVVRLLATESGRALPFSVFAPLLAGGPADPDPATLPHRLIAALGAAAGASGGRSVLVMDDAHLLDERSAAALLAVVIHGGTAVIATVRAGSRPCDAVAALWRDQGLARIELTALDVRDTERMLTERLGGEVAQVTAWSMWRQTQGNPLYLDELILFGLHTGRLTRTEGVFWWSGEAEVSPRLEDLLGRRIDEADAAARPAIEVLAMGEPMRLSLLTGLTSVEAVERAVERGLLTVDQGPTGHWVHFAHPMIAAVAARRLSPVRRRVLAEQLRSVPGVDADLLRRAAWEEAATDTPDADLLLRAALSALVADPHTTVRLAARAEHGDPGPSSSVLKADAFAELGMADDAVAALAVARSRVRDDDDRVAVGISSSSLHLWTMRDPVRADAELATLAAQVGGAHRDHLVGARALTAVFSGRPVVAAELAAGARDSADRAAALRARLACYAAAVLTESPQAPVARRSFADLAATGPVRPSYPSLLAAFDALGRHLFGDGGAIPQATGQAGRWPVDAGGSTGPDPTGHGYPGEFGAIGGASRSEVTAGQLRSVGKRGIDRAVDAAAWALVKGIRLRSIGEFTEAARVLREALVQQWAGEGIFRSEATAFATVALLESGRAEQAARVWAQYPADAVCCVPGLRSWTAGLLTADVDVGQARWLFARAAEDAAGQQSPTVALGYLMSLVWTSDAAGAADLARQLGLDGGGGRAAAYRAAISAAAGSDREALDAAAAALRRVGLVADADRLIHRPDGPLPHPRRRTANGDPSWPPLPGLTGRESEIAVLAGRGLRDREIADLLVVSVRTIESHLAAAYRKLGITSRRDLRTVLAQSEPAEGMGGGQPPHTRTDLR